MAEMKQPKELLIHELGDLLYAERRFRTAIRHMLKEVSDKQIHARLEKHLKETEGQIDRLTAAFESIGEDAKGEKCDAAIGLREEHDSFKSEEKPSSEILEAFDLGSGLRVEHYEIAGYTTAITMAKVLGYDECARILGESLAEEQDMADFLVSQAPRALESLFAKAKADADDE